jgi:hypothetical protein
MELCRCADRHYERARLQRLRQHSMVSGLQSPHTLDIAQFQDMAHECELCHINNERTLLR